MKPLCAIMVVLAAFSGILLWRTLSPRPPTQPTRLPAAPEEPRPQGNSAGEAASQPLLRPICGITDERGRRHALLTRSPHHGLYYRYDGEEAILLDTGVQVGTSVDLAVSKNGHAFAAYCDARTGEVRFAAPHRAPRRWISLRRLRQPSRCTLTVDRVGVLVSYFDESTGDLCYSYLNRAGRSWRHGVASRGGRYRVVTGRPGALVMSR